MGLVSQVLPSFNGGVSQQPDRSRFLNQVSEQNNGLSSEVEGTQKRPPTTLIKDITSGTRLSLYHNNNKFHVINRDDDEQYIVIFNGYDVEIYDKNGNKQTVTNATASYTRGNAEPRKNIRCVTVADYTFVLNKSVVPQMDGFTTTQWNDNWALVYIKMANYGKTYAIYVDDVFAVAVMMPDGSEAKHASVVNTAKIIQKLYDVWYNGGATYGDYDSLINLSSITEVKTARNPNFSFSKYSFGYYGDNTIGIRYSGSSTTIPKVTVKDGIGNTYAYPLLGKASSISKLPPVAPNNCVIKIQAEQDSEDSTYYVRYDASSNCWVETIKGGIHYAIKASTMPHAIVRNSDGTFTIKELEWANRVVGDEDTNPDPSFIGVKLNDIFFYRNRLGLVADENVILSATSDFYNFWFDSSTTIIDTDPIDVALSSNRVSIITDVIPFAKELMLFSRGGQFVLKADSALTPKTVSVDQTTAFEYSLGATPITLGQSLYFVTERAKSSALMRYFTMQDISENKDAEDVSSHVPTYIPTNIGRISGSTAENLLLLTEEQSNTVSVYKFIMQGSNILQQSWSKWTFGDCVFFCDFIGSNLYLIVARGSRIYLEKLVVTSPDVLDFSDEPYRLYLDCKTNFKFTKGTYNSWTDETTFKLSDCCSFTGITKGTKFTIVTPEGENLEYEYNSTDTFTARGDYTGLADGYVGFNYTFKLKLTQLLLKNADNGQVVVTDNGRLQVRNITLYYDTSGVFNVDVFNKRKNKTYTYVSTGKTIGTNEVLIGQPSITDGEFKVAVQDKNTDVEITVRSDNSQPCTIVSGKFDALFIPKTQRI